MAALDVLATLRETGAPASGEQQATIARYGSWGAVPEVFDQRRQDWHGRRVRLMESLGAEGYEAARKTTMNAHFTDPAIIGPMWRTLGGLGFEGGRVLEPGSGMGTFIGMAPEGAQLVGVELDPTTADLSRVLYPDATIRTEGFEDTRFPNGTFDAAIGNVPFGNFNLPDRSHNPAAYSIHNHFILKSLNLVRPGGLAAFVTSAYTLDAQNAAAREDMYERADLVGAVRLPSGAFQRSAGTSVLTDVLIFRVRIEGEDYGDATWVYSSQQSVPFEQDRGSADVRVNDYFTKHPDRVMGTMVVIHGVRGSVQLGVRAHDRDTPWTAQFEDALAHINADARADNLTMTPRTTVETADIEFSLPEGTPESIRWDGHIEAVGDDFVEYTDGQPAPMTDMVKDASTRRELRALLDLRDLGTNLLQMESQTTGDDPAVTAQRDRLRSAWETYRDTYGPINRFKATWHEGKNGPYLVPRYPTAMQKFRRDPFCAFVKALEHFDEDSQTARPADLLLQRAVAQRHVPQGADSIQDALAMTLDTRGHVDLDEIARLRSISPEDARAELGTLVYEDPATERLVPAAEYLSGNVRIKLDQAREAAQADPDRYGVNVPALEAVIPTDLTASDIEPQVGASWIPASDHEAFLRELLGATEKQLTIQSDGQGGFTGRQVGVSRLTRATVTWGTERKNAYELFMAMAENKSIMVFDKNEDGSRVVNNTETAAANAKAEDLRERFQVWIWEDPDRAARLARSYNDSLNALVMRDYSESGKILTFPGMAETWRDRLKDHQRTAIARMINEPATGLFHQVGAGKTASMVAGSMELKRLGLASKPAIVVPNHMLEQFSREFLEIYPQARLLAAGNDDLQKDKRRQFVARVANNDWDCVIMTAGAFKSLGMRPESEAQVVRETITKLRATLEGAQANGEDLSVKQIEGAVQRHQTTLRKALDKPRDPGITFEDTGIDYLSVDEAHLYKNLTVPSNIQGAGKSNGSDRATDMKMKLDYLRSVHGERVATFATGTPIANSVSEAYVMQSYLRPDLLTAAGIDSFDSWASTFGKVVDSTELVPQGGSFRNVQRFAQFQNVPELMRMMHTYADVKMAEDLNLPVPSQPLREDGRRGPLMEMVPPTRTTLDFIQTLQGRAERIKNGLVDRTEDNMLKLSAHGRMAALSPELVGWEDPASTNGKIARAARSIAQTYHDTKDREYETDGGVLTPGALQIVFADLRTAKDVDYDAYEELRDRLTEAGVPREGIRFMQDAGTDKKKAQLFADCRNGKVSVLVGSTMTMGTGTNVQRRAIALHHLDCPWRPADVQQREGRILRQGNANDEISIHRWATQKSFDAYSWQTVERKSKFIDQIMRGTLDMRTIDDISDNSFDYGVVAATTADNPYLIEKTKLTGEIQRLNRLERAHNAEQQNLRIRVPQMREGLNTVDASIAALRALGEKTQDVSGTNFTMEVQGETFAKRADAGRALEQWAKSTRFWGSFRGDSDLGQVASLAGHPIHAVVLSTADTGAAPSNPVVSLRVPGAPAGHDVQMKASDLTVLDHRIITSLENKVTGMTREADKFERQVPQRRIELQEAESHLGAEFKHAHLLRLTRKQLDDVEKKMAAHERDRDDGPEGPTLDDPDPSGPGGGDGGPKPPQRPTGPSHGAESSQPYHRATHRPQPASAGHGTEID